MYRKIVPMILAMMLAAAGCSLLGGGGLKPGETAQGDLSTGVEIEELIPDAEEVLLKAGIAVEDDWPAVEFPLAETEDGISILIEEDDIDPVIVVIDADGKILAAGDDWDGELDAFVSMDKVTAGARAVVFDATGDDGEFLLEAGEAEDFMWALETGDEMEAFILRDKDGELWEDLVYDSYDIWREGWETCRAVPLEISDDMWVKVEIESDVDCVMAIMMVDGDDLEYIDYDDDTNGMNPVYAGEMEAGSYLCIVDTYGGSEDAEFTISITELDADEMSADIVEAEEPDTWYTGEFRPGSMVMAYWPEAGDYWGVYPEEQVVVFEFDIHEDGEYIFDVSSYDDTKMAIIDGDSYMIDYNDDGPEGLDPQLTLQLAPGSYAALVTPYTEMSTEFVDFRYTLAAPVERERGFAPMEFDEYRSDNVYLHLVVDPGDTWEVFAESSTDLTLTVVDGAGETWFSDDDGGDFNPWMEIEATQENAGAWLIDIESYGGSGINDNVHFVIRPVRNQSANSSAQIEIDI